MMSFELFAKKMTEAAANVKPALMEAAADIALIQHTLAYGYIGQELPIWPALADSTVAEKERLGYFGQVSETDPLLRDGDMRESIEAAVVPDLGSVFIVLGSDSLVALYQEMGTSTIPPRPFLSTATAASIPEAKNILNRLARDLLAGQWKPNVKRRPHIPHGLPTTAPAVANR